MKENPRMCHWNAPSSISPMTLTLLTEKIKETDLRHFCLFFARVHRCGDMTEGWWTNHTPNDVTVFHHRREGGAGIGHTPPIAMGAQGGVTNCTRVVCTYVCQA